MKVTSESLNNFIISAFKKYPIGGKILNMSLYNTLPFATSELINVSLPISLKITITLFPKRQ